MILPFFQDNYNIDFLRLLYIDPNWIVFFKDFFCAQSHLGTVKKAYGMVSVLPLLMWGYTYENEQQFSIESDAKMPGQRITAIRYQKWETSMLSQVIEEDFMEEMGFELGLRGCAILV